MLYQWTCGWFFKVTFVLLQRTSNEVKERDSPVPRELRGLHSGSHLPVLRWQFSRRSVQRPGWVDSLLTCNDALVVTAFFLKLFSDEYFVSNIEKVDSVTLLRKDKVMNGVSWPARFQQAISTWPYLNDLGSAAAQVSTDMPTTRNIQSINQSVGFFFRTHDVVHANVINRQLWSKCLDSLTTKTLSSQFSLMTRPALIG